MRRAPLYAAMLGAFVLAGCGDDATAPSRVCGEQGCSAQCEQLRGENCDILDEACQQRIFDAVVCVRGTRGELPDVRTITPDEYRAELLENAGEDAGIEDVIAEQTWSTGLGLIGLLDPSETSDSAAIEDRIENVAGYYDVPTGTITLIDRERAEDSDYAQSVLTHELVHALQDQEMGLYELYRRTGRSNDSWYARSCLVEGEATLYEELAISLLRGLPADPGYWDVSLAWSLKRARGEVAIARSPYAALWQLNYPVGARFLTDAWLQGGNQAVQGLYWAVPQSAIYWMHGYVQVVERAGQLVRPLACNVAAEPIGYELVTDDSLGPFAVYALLAHDLRAGGVAPIEQAWQDALQWRQDSLSLFRNEMGRVAVSWRILFESAEVAERAARKLSDPLAPTERVAFARGAELELLAAQAFILLNEWKGTDPSACPTQPD
jgi:hypothetical protein